MNGLNGIERSINVCVEVFCQPVYTDIFYIGGNCHIPTAFELGFLTHGSSLFVKILFGFTLVKFVCYGNVYQVLFLSFTNLGAL